MSKENPEPIEIIEEHENWSEYTLSNGVKLKIKPVLQGVQFVGSDPNGMPMLSFQVTFVTRPTFPKEMLKHPSVATNVR